MFEDKPEYEGLTQHFISTYRIGKFGYGKFMSSIDGVIIPGEQVTEAMRVEPVGNNMYRTRGPNLGEPKIKKKLRKIEKAEKLKQLEDRKKKEQSMYKSLEPHQKISDQQMREAKRMKKELDGMSPTLPGFTEKHEKLLKRAKDNLDAMDKMREQQDEF